MTQTALVQQLRALAGQLSCLLLAGHLLCLSIDAPDAFLLLNGREDSRINDIESLYELVAETCLDLIVPEADEGAEDIALLKAPNFEFTLPVRPSLRAVAADVVPILSSGLSTPVHGCPHRPSDVTIPPPKHTV